jgi:HK97 family phage portal protein
VPNALDIIRAGLAPIAKATPGNASPVSDYRGGWTTILESFSGAWQRNVVVDTESVFAHHAFFACMTLIASDFAKNRVKLVSLDTVTGIWSEVTNAAYSPVLRKPNRFQTRIQFLETWALSKLSRGNTVVLKQRDNRNVVVALYVLDWTRVTPLVTPDGSIYYELRTDNLAGIQETSVVVPASEIIHDRFNCLFHPLVGLSPVYAAGLAATQGLKIQNHSTNFFANGARPGGTLTAPGRINQETADRLKQDWQDKYAGAENAGKLVVLGDGLKYEQMTMNSHDAQLIEQLKWSAEVVCSTFHVPPYKIGVGQEPANANVQTRNMDYYTQCLQVLFEAAEVLLDEGLATGERLGTEFDTDNLLRMDSVTQMEVLDKGKNVMAPNEARKVINLKPVPGGDSVFRQQQDYSLEALAKRDAQDDPFGKAAPAATEAPPPAANDDEEAQRQARAAIALYEKRFRERLYA